MMCLVNSVVPVNEGCHRDDDNGDHTPFLELRPQPDVAVGVKYVMVLSYTQVLGLSLAAFAVGTLIPYICWDSHHSVPQSPPILSSSSGNKLFNNLRYSSPTTRTADERRSPKIAWRKYRFSFTCHVARSPTDILTRYLCLFLLATHSSHGVSQFRHNLHNRIDHCCQQHVYGHQLR